MNRRFIFNRQRVSAYLFCIFCGALILVLSGCGDSTSEQGTTGQFSPAASESGAASFSVRWHAAATDRSTAGSLSRQAIDDCTSVRVASISCQVYDESNSLIAIGGPWSCAAHTGRVQGIVAGSDRTFIILGWDNAEGVGDPIYKGLIAGVTIAAGKIADAGIIDAYAFSPSLSDPKDDATDLPANRLSLAWDSVAVADGYRIMVSEDNDLATLLLDQQTTETTLTVLNLTASTTYHWTIHSIDQYGNESANSDIWNFTTSASQLCNVPVLDPIGDQQTAENEMLTFTLNATDPDSGALTFSAGSLPTGAALDSQTGIFSWTPGYGAAGNYPVAFTVCDDCPQGPQCDSEQVTITVGDVCRPPVLNPIGNRQVDENRLLGFSISATDPDGGVLTYSAGNLPTGAIFDSQTQTFSWTPGFGAAGNYPVTFTVCDDCPQGPQCDSEQVTITVGNVCRPPVLSRIGNQQVDENRLLAFTISATDPDGDTLTYSAGSLPTGATFNSQTRTFNWTPGFGAAGSYDATFTVCDDCPQGPQCDSEQVTITVGDVCRPPVLGPIGNRQVAENQTLAFTLDATDPDGGTLAYSAGNLPAGAAFNSQTRTFSWTPGYGAAGRYDNVTFTVCDDCPSGPQCDSEQVTITVGDVCRAPVLSPIGNRQVAEDQNLTFTIDATDPDGGVLTYNAVNLPAGAAFNNQTRTFSWTPGYAAAGSYGVTFTVCDDCPQGPQCDSEQVTIDVGDVCRSPVLDPIGDRQVVEGRTLAFSLNATDPDGGALTYSARNMPAGATFDVRTRTFSWTPAFGAAGSYDVDFMVCDDCINSAQCDSEQVTITVTGALPVVTVTATDNIAVESAKSPDLGYFRIDRTGSTQSPLTVFLAVSGTADNGKDYTYIPASITLGVDQSNANIAVVPIDDQNSESDETVQLTIQASNAYVIGKPYTATVIIRDDENRESIVVGTWEESMYLDCQGLPGLNTLIFHADHTFDSVPRCDGYTGRWVLQGDVITFTYTACDYPVYTGTINQAGTDMSGTAGAKGEFCWRATKK